MIPGSREGLPATGWAWTSWPSGSSPHYEPFLAGQSHLLETATFFFAGHPQLELPNNRRPRGKIQYMTDLVESENTELLEGRWPRGPGFRCR